MRPQVFLFFLLIIPVVYAGCADRQILPRLTSNATLGSREQIRITDPQGPIPAPNLPAELSRASGAPPADEHRGDYRYTVVCTVQDSTARGGQHAAAGKKNGEPSGDPSVLLSDFEKASTLHRLEDTPPETLTGLEQRLAVALGEARQVLNSRGYYSGRVRGAVEPAGPSPESGKTQSKATVRIVFTPGPQYRMGKTAIIAALPENAGATRDKLPKTLADAGLADGAPAEAAAVLAAVDKARAIYMDNGFPFAAVSSTRYTADHATHTLDAEIHIRPGAFVRMGTIRREGAPSVKDRYIDAQQTWKPGEPWNQSKVDAFRDALRQGGLFQSVDVRPAEKPDGDGLYAVDTILASAPERTLSGALKYHSDFGPGIQGNWEHRNLTGRGDSLRLSLPLWLDMQEFSATYRLPYFLRRDQDFIAKGGLLNQDTDAYRLTSGAFSAGIERRLARYLTGTAQGSVEGGAIKEPDKPSREYLMFGLPFSLAYDNTGSLLNAVKGQRLTVSLAPYQGKYEGNFSVLRGRLDAQAFVPLKGEDSLVLAMRGTVGAVEGADSGKIPPSIRFYSGGGGSVRGYEYQSLGPRNEDDKPLGGGSLAEVSAEARWKLTPEWGLVAFVDGGTAYENVFSDPGRVMRWGAGLGVRYYTVIGPVRFDLATPLNPRSDDDPLQFYISIGQSF